MSYWNTVKSNWQNITYKINEKDYEIFIFIGNNESTVHKYFINSEKWQCEYMGSFTKDGRSVLYGYRAFNLHGLGLV